PLELLTTVEWVAGPARGTIIVGDVDNTAELTQVEPVEGTSVVKLIRSLVPPVRSTSDGLVPDKKPASERSMPGRATRRAAAETDRSGTGPVERRPSSSGGV